MTEVQGWIAIASGVVGLLLIVVRVSGGFSKLQTELHYLGAKVAEGFRRNDSDHKGMREKLDAHDSNLATLEERSKHRRNGNP